MKDTNIQKGNKLIKQFMNSNMDYYNAKYHDSYEELIPVIKKIFNLPIKPNNPGHILQLGDLQLAVYRLNLDEMYNSTIKFIEWYNTNYK